MRVCSHSHYRSLKSHKEVKRNIYAVITFVHDINQICSNSVKNFRVISKIEICRIRLYNLDSPKLEDCLAETICSPDKRELDLSICEIGGLIGYERVD